MLKTAANLVNRLLSPLLIPTFATLVLLHSNFHLYLFPWPVKRFLVIIIFLTTGLMPALTLTISRFGRHSGLAGGKLADNRIAMIFIALYYYLGYFILNKMGLYPVFKIMLLGGALLTVVWTIISLWYDISLHTAALGGVFGMLVALSLRVGTNPVLLLILTVFLAGLAGSARLISRRQDLSGVLAGYPVGFALFFLLFYYL